MAPQQLCIIITNQRWRHYQPGSLANASTHNEQWYTLSPDCSLKILWILIFPHYSHFFVAIYLQVFSMWGHFPLLSSATWISRPKMWRVPQKPDGSDPGGTVHISILLSSPASVLSFSLSCVCVSRGSRLTPDPELMRAITRIKRGWLQGVWVWGLNNYTVPPTCFSSWLRKLQSPPPRPPLPHTRSAGTQKKGLWKIINYLRATLTWM